MIGQNLQCVIYWADFAIWSLPARYDYLNEQNLSTLKLAIYIVLWKRPLRIPVNTKHTAVYQVSPSAVPACEVLYLHWILGHKTVGKVKFWDSRKSVSTKAPVPNKICPKTLSERALGRRVSCVCGEFLCQARVTVAMLLRWIWGREAIVDIARYVNNLKFSLEFLT